MYRQGAQAYISARRTARAGGRHPANLPMKCIQAGRSMFEVTSQHKHAAAAVTNIMKTKRRMQVRAFVEAATNAE